MADFDLEFKELRTAVGDLVTKVEVALNQMAADRSKVEDGKAERQKLSDKIDALEKRVESVEKTQEVTNANIENLTRWLSRGVGALIVLVTGLLWAIFTGQATLSFP